MHTRLFTFFLKMPPLPYSIFVSFEAVFPQY